MSAKQQALALAEKLGVDLNIGGGRHFEVIATAPDGKIFSETETHETVNSAWDNETSASVWRKVVSDLSGGVEDCDNPECEWCHGEGELS